MSKQGIFAAALAAFALAATPAAAQEKYFDVGKLPLPPVDGKELADSVASFSTTYAPRVTGTSGDAAAAEALRAEAESFGYQTEIRMLPVAGGDPGTVARAVIATKRGLTKPDEHILFMGHYDTVAGFGGVTINGAYDNASGTMMIRALAKSLAKVPTNRTLSFVWYNGEEEGLVASESHAAAEKAAGMQVRAVLGFDMVGIAYPVASPGGPTCLCMWHGDEDEAFEPLLRHINYGVLGFPEAEELVHIEGVNARNSDERSWDAQGYPVLRWAGLRRAADYPAYHMPDDTIETIDAVAGGRNFFEQGLRNTLVSSYLTTLALDSAMPVAAASATGKGPVSFSAAGSSDPDGSPSHYAWDFGDGTRDTGANVTHTYAKPGSYVATVSVGDNIWPQVTAKAAIPVEVTTGTATAKPKPKKAKRKKCKRGYKRATKGKKKGRCVKIKRKKKRSRR